MTRAVRVLSEQRTIRCSLVVYELPDWLHEFGVVAGLTGCGDRFDVGLASEDPAAKVLARWESLGGAFAGSFSGLVVSRQVHGDRIAVHQSAHTGLLIQEGLDGHVTGIPGLLLVVTVADCIPVYLVEAQSGTLCLLHAGWRGIAAGVLEVGISRLIELTSASPQDVVMHCGIGICGECYHVGPEVQKTVCAAGVGQDGTLDLRDVLADRAGRLGLRRISLSAHCTAHEGSEFYSHRGSGGSAGRMAAYLGRPMA